MKIITFILLFLSFSIQNSYASKEYVTDGQKYTIETLFQGKDVIWGFDFLKNSNNIIFSEREGKLKILNLTTKKVVEVAGAPKVFTESQGGLLDVLVDSKSEWIYLTYSEPTQNGATTSLYRAKLSSSSDHMKLEGSRLFQAKAFARGGIHFGSRVVLDGKGYIYLSVGERNDRDKAQDLSTHQGKILRLNLDGSIPKDNPFINTPKALGEIWSYGHRNPQGLVITSKGDLLNAEFGPRGGDEVNLVLKGENYGWPLVTYGAEYYGPSIGVTSKPGMKQPLFYWVPSISPSGIMEYTGEAFPKFKGNLFLATLSGSHLHRIVVSPTFVMLQEEKLLLDLEERFRHVKMGPDGLIYLSSDSGKLLRLVPVR